MEIEIENETLTHLLGYLSPKQWVDVIKYHKLDKDLVMNLIKIQDSIYKTRLEETVKDLLELEDL